VKGELLKFVRKIYDVIGMNIHYDGFVNHVKVVYFDLILVMHEGVCFNKRKLPEEGFLAPRKGVPK